MLKYVFMLIFTLFFYLKMKHYFWLVHLFYFVMAFVWGSLCVFSYFFGELSYFLGADLMSFGLILLSFWILSLMFFASEKVYYYLNNLNVFVFVLNFLMLMLIFMFISLNFLMFYLFFESSLIPTLILIMGWGYQPERIQAGGYLMFYCLFGSLPLLLVILYIYNYMDFMNFYMLKFVDFEFVFLYVYILFAFIVKMPMYMFHLWLPKAHVEAPISGSMILAGVLLKIGGYGMLRVYPMVLKMGVYFNFVWISISLFGGFITSLMCLRQIDMKALIAYSSVAHMAIVMGGMMTLFSWGLSGSYSLMLGHGLCSSGLFCLANMVYERVKSRSLFISKGMISFMPSMGMWWFLLSSSNMAAPPSLNLLGEVSLINSVVGWSFYSMLLISLISFFSAAYCLYLYSFIQHGKILSDMFFFSSGTVRENFLFFYHWFPLNLVVLLFDGVFLLI